MVRQSWPLRARFREFVWENPQIWYLNLNPLSIFLGTGWSIGPHIWFSWKIWGLSTKLQRGFWKKLFLAIFWLFLDQNFVNFPIFEKILAQK